jgi:hypothetical protein
MAETFMVKDFMVKDLELSSGIMAIIIDANELIRVGCLTDTNEEFRRACFSYRADVQQCLGTPVQMLAIQSAINQAIQGATYDDDIRIG